MMARTWRGRASPAKADDYQRHFEGLVVPNLQSIPGRRGAWLLRREVDGGVELVAVTLWESLATIRQFSGDDPTAAHVEPEGRAALASFDAFATHCEIACSTLPALVASSRQTN